MKCSYFYQNDRNGANHCEFPSRGLCHFSINVTDDSVIEETSILTNSWVLSIELREWWKVNAPFQMMCVRCARVLRSVDRFATFDNPTLSQELLTLLLPGDLDWPSIQASFLTNRHIKRYMKNQHHDTSRAFHLLIIHHLHILSLPTPSINLSLLQTLLKLLWDILQLLQFLLESTRRTAGDGACIFREGG